MMHEAAFVHAVDEKMRGALAAAAAALDISPEQSGLRSGKRVRPRFVHACAEALDLPARQSVSWAALVEMIHVASLVHDDVIDGAQLRRGQVSIAAREGNRNAVLTGDLLVSAAWLTASHELPREVTGLLASAMIAMTTAELRERELIWNPAATLASYLRVIDGKTAALFAAAAEGCAVLAGAPAATRAALAGFGQALGRAFQIQDDVRDYRVSTDISGKDRMKDLQEGLVTLPLIIALRHGGARAHAVEDHLASHGSSPLDVETLAALLAESAAVERSLRLGRRRLWQGLQSLEGTVAGEQLQRVALASLGWKDGSPTPWALSA